MDAHGKGDIHGLTALLREDLRFAMPPEPGSWVGRDAVVRIWVDGGFGSASLGQWRCLPTSANRQPAVAAYLRRPDDTEFRLTVIDVLRLEDGFIAEITAFPAESCPAFDLPPTLHDTTSDMPATPGTEA